MVAADPQHGCLQVVEAPLRDASGDLRAGAVEHRCLVDHDQPAGLLDRGLDGVEVDRGHRAQVHDLDRLALLLGCRGGLQADLHHRAVGRECEVRAGTGDGGPVQLPRDGLGVELALVPVAALRLEEDDRVVALDGLLHHPVGVGRVGGRDHLQSRDVREQCLGRLAVVLDGADAAAVRNPHDDRQLDLAERTGVHLRELRDDLVVRGEDEAVELDLHDGPVAAQGQADRRADDAGLGERGVDHPVLAEVLLESVGDPEDPAQLADVLTHDEDLGVGVESLAQRLVERLRDGHLFHGHGYLPSSANDAW